MDEGDPFDPYNRGLGGPIQSTARPIPAPSPLVNTLWETVGPVALGLLGGLAFGATAYLGYRCWAARSVQGASSKLFVLYIVNNMYYVR